MIVEITTKSEIFLSTRGRPVTRFSMEHTISILRSAIFSFLRTFFCVLRDTQRTLTGVQWHPYQHGRVPSRSYSCHLSNSDRHFFVVVESDLCDLAFCGVVVVVANPCLNPGLHADGPERVTGTSTRRVPGRAGRCAGSTGPRGVRPRVAGCLSEGRKS